MLPSKVAQGETLLTCIREVLCSNLGRETILVEVFVGSCVAIAKCLDIPASYDVTASFHTVSNPLFTDRSTIRSCTALRTASSNKDVLYIFDSICGEFPAATHAVGCATPLRPVLPLYSEHRFVTPRGGMPVRVFHSWEGNFARWSGRLRQELSRTGKQGKLAETYVYQNVLPLFHIYSTGIRLSQ